MTSKVARLSAFMMMASLVACVGTPAQSPEERVEQRAMAQAEALMTADFDLALSYMAPSYRSSDKSIDFKRRRSGATGWQRAEVKWVRCDEGPNPERCEVRLMVWVFRPPAMSSPITVPVDDIWILTEGDWYQFR